MVNVYIGAFDSLTLQKHTTNLGCGFETLLTAGVLFDLGRPRAIRCNP